MDLLESLPALPPPPGTTSNFDDPYSGAPPVGAAIGVVSALATSGFSLRVFTKVYLMRTYQVEDYLLSIGWCFFVTYVAFAVNQFPYVTGRHQWDVRLSQIGVFLESLNFSELFYCFCMGFTKLAILFQVRRIFIIGSTRNSVYWLTLTTMVLNGAFYIAAVVTLIAQCVPREKISNPSVPGVCVDNNAQLISSGSFNFTLDILIFMLPIYAILRLKLNFKRKLGICAIFATGLLACISSFLRLYYSIQLLNVSDQTYGILNLAWTACLEGASAILVAAFPVYPRLYKYLREKVAKQSSTEEKGDEEEARQIQAPILHRVHVDVPRTPYNTNTTASSNATHRYEHEVEAEEGRQWTPLLK